MAQVTVADIKLNDNYDGLSTTALKTAMDTALPAVAAVFAQNITDGERDQDNITMLFREAINQQVVA